MNSFEPLSVKERERRLLAPYAMFSSDSAGRVHLESGHSYRGPFQRDRDRILHSSAYRRLSGKMQVFTGEMGDYHRTRLTHTQEVATIARTIARMLRLNEDLVEALALVHDIGHPPYGHAGEDALDDCLANDGGFSHNRFALTIVEELERRYTSFPGLNLTREVLTGQIARTDKNSTGPRPLLEVQLVDAADSTTYDAHDTDDAIKLGLVTLDEMAEMELIGECIQHVRQQYTSLDDDMMRKAVVHRLVERQVSDMLDHCIAELNQRQFQSATDAINSDFIISPSDELAAQKLQLEKFLYDRVYRHPKLNRIRGTAQRRLRDIVAGYVERPELIPYQYQHRIERIGALRTSVEYVAGMTDHFCEQVFQQHFRE